jgi:hypothetical protein
LPKVILNKWKHLSRDSTRLFHIRIDYQETD